MNSLSGASTRSIGGGWLRVTIWPRARQRKSGEPFDPPPAFWLDGV
jgi:hypothetical protein